MTPLILLLILHTPLPVHTIPVKQVPKFTVGYVCEVPKKEKEVKTSLRRAGQRRAG